MTTTIERTQEIALEMLGAARENLKKDGWLRPMVFFVRAGKLVTMMVIEGVSDLKAKARAYGVAAFVARRLRADAVILLNDSYVKALADEGGPAPPMGALAMDPDARECVAIAIKGPVVGTHTVIQTYVRNEVGDIVFDDRWPFLELGSEVMPDWWKET